VPEDRPEPSCDSIVRAVLAGERSEPISMLVSRLPPYGMSRFETVRALHSPEMAIRITGLASVLLHLAYGCDPVFASELGQALLRSWRGTVERIAFASEHLESMVMLSVIRSTAQSLLLTGAFDRCVQLIDEWLLPERFRRFGAEYVAAYLRKAEAFAHQLKIAEASSVLDGLTDQERETAAQDIAIVARYIAAYVVPVLQPDEIFDYRKRVQELVDGPLAENREIVSLWSETWNAPTIPREHRDWANAKLDVLRNELERLTAVSADPELTDADRVDRLMRGLRTIGLGAREVLLAGAPVAALDLHGADERINHAAMIRGLVRPTSEEIARALDAASEAAAWCQAKGCKRGLLSAIQAERGLHARANERSKAHDANLRLYAELRLIREQSPMPEVRAAIARVYHSLLIDICRSAEEASSPATAFSATEFRRGLSVVEPRRPLGWVAPDPLVNPLPAAFLGPKTHYLGLTAFDENDRIGASLYCADGTIAFGWIPLTPARFRKAAERLNPRDWDESPPLLGKPRVDPRPRFASLLEPIREALANGRILEGDHVCIAADDPIHAVPLHYLPLHDMPAVNVLSFSRVTSLADARLVFESLPERPRRAWTAFVPAMPERDVDSKAAAFSTVCAILQSAAVDVTPSEGTAVDRAAVMAALAEYPLIYIHSHGTFDEEFDPLDRVGILVSEDGQLPFRGAERLSLLTPRCLLDGDASLPGSVVALSACVSGLGRRGAGGDTIGLEFALRARGASSVIASHWDVAWDSAAAFFAAFFERWLVDGERRADAWRHAILDRAASPGGRAAGSAVLEACAFSLFGDWR
jgi:hypothetical protein